MEPPSQLDDPLHWTGEECAAFDAYLQRDLHLPAELLMESAATALARWVRVLLRSAEIAPTVCWLIGPGNNGGDGLVAARKLHGEQGIAQSVWAPAGLPAAATGAAALAVRTWKELHLPTTTTVDPPADWDRGLLVDGLFGVGLQRPVQGPLAQVLKRIATNGCPVLAVDCPSGLDATTGEVLGTALPARWTLSFLGPKSGFGRHSGPQMCGRVRCAGIGVSTAFAYAWLHQRRQHGAG